VQDSNRSLRVIVTGGAGFIGSTLVRTLVERGHTCAVIDALTYAGRVDNVNDGGVNRALIYQNDVNERAAVRAVIEHFQPDAIAHLAADSHVQSSFRDFTRFLRTNVEGTESILESALLSGISNVLHVSTDEVFGDVAPGEWAFEDAPLRPRNPYAASKAAAEMVVRAYQGYRGLPVKMARLSNCYGPRQHVEKLIPRVVARISAGLPVELHGGGRQVRQWLHVEDAARALAVIIERGEGGQTYNVPSTDERSVAKVASEICDHMKRGEVIDAPDRPGGNDQRYGMSERNITPLGWTPVMPFSASLRSTVDYFVEHSDRIALDAIAEAA
jgi:dTDP-glucose 4,6-dehydratase